MVQILIIILFTDPDILGPVISQPKYNFERIRSELVIKHSKRKKDLDPWIDDSEGLLEEETVDDIYLEEGGLGGLQNSSLKDKDIVSGTIFDPNLYDDLGDETAEAIKNLEAEIQNMPIEVYENVKKHLSAHVVGKHLNIGKLKGQRFNDIKIGTIFARAKNSDKFVRKFVVEAKLKANQSGKTITVLLRMVTVMLPNFIYDLEFVAKKVSTYVDIFLISKSGKILLDNVVLPKTFLLNKNNFNFNSNILKSYCVSAVPVNNTALNVITVKSIVNFELRPIFMNNIEAIKTWTVLMYDQQYKLIYHNTLRFTRKNLNVKRYSLPFFASDTERLSLEKDFRGCNLAEIIRDFRKIIFDNQRLSKQLVTVRTRQDDSVDNNNSEEFDILDVLDLQPNLQANSDVFVKREGTVGNLINLLVNTWTKHKSTEDEIDDSDSQLILPVVQEPGIKNYLTEYIPLELILEEQFLTFMSTVKSKRDIMNDRIKTHLEMWNTDLNPVHRENLKPLNLMLMYQKSWSYIQFRHRRLAKVEAIELSNSVSVHTKAWFDDYQKFTFFAFIVNKLINNSGQVSDIVPNEVKIDALPTT